MRPFRSRFTSAHVLAALALFVALGGPSFASDAVDSAVKRITGKEVKNNSLTTKDIKNRSLLRKDFKKGQLTAPGTGAQVLAKLIGVDGPGSGLDADRVDGLGAGAFQRRGATTACASGDVMTGLGASGDVACAPDGSGFAHAASVLRLSPEATNSAQGKTLHPDFEIYDTSDLHTGASESLVAPVSGTYVVSASVQWDANSAGYRNTGLIGPGGSFATAIEPPNASPAVTEQNVTGVERMAAGQAVHIEVLQGSGASINVRVDRFEMTYVGR